MIDVICVLTRYEVILYCNYNLHTDRLIDVKFKNRFTTKKLKKQTSNIYTKDDIQLELLFECHNFQRPLNILKKIYFLK